MFYVFSAGDLKGNAVGWFNINSNTQLKQRRKRFSFVLSFSALCVILNKHICLESEWPAEQL